MDLVGRVQLVSGRVVSGATFVDIRWGPPLLSMPVRVRVFGTLPCLGQDTWSLRPAGCPPVRLSAPAFLEGGQLKIPVHTISCDLKVSAAFAVTLVPT